jgi:hypothetical protein
MRASHSCPKGFLLAAASLVWVLLFSAVSYADETDELLNLAQSGVDEDVMITFIDQSSDVFDLTADDIVSLKNLGVSPRVINEAMHHNRSGNVAPGQGSPPPEEMAPPQRDMNVSSFYEAMYPYGTWLNVEGMWCWRPNACDGEPGWTPYCNHGHWVYTDWGWTWVSEYQWGWAPFHYGRWYRHHDHGWLWVPDNEWGPAWVSWRTSPDYFGWAPLPPRARFVRSQGFFYGDRQVGPDFEFELTLDDYCFVDNRHFCDPELRPHVVPPHILPRIFAASAIVRSNYSTVENRIVDRGPAPAFVERVTHVPVRPFPIVAADIRPGQPIHPGHVSGNQLIIFKPPIAPGAPESPLVVRQRMEKAPHVRIPAPPQPSEVRAQAMQKRRADAMAAVVRKSRDEANAQENHKRQLEEQAAREQDPRKRESLRNEAAEASRKAQEERQHAEKVEKWTPPPQGPGPHGHQGPVQGDESQRDHMAKQQEQGHGVSADADEERKRHDEQEKRDRDRREQESR